MSENEEEYKVFEFCTTETKLDTRTEHNMKKCFENGYKFGFITNDSSIATRFREHLKLHDGTYFVFKDEHFKRIYVSMCRHLNLDKLVGRNQSPLNDILILIFEGYCIYFLAINASQYYNYVIEIPVMMDKLKNDPDSFYREIGDENRFLHRMNTLFVQRMDLRRVFNNISSICELLYKQVKRHRPDLLNRKKGGSFQVVVKNILLGMKFKSCSEKSPLKFLDADAERDSFVDYLKVQPHSKTREEETKEPEGIPSGLNQPQVPLRARSPINEEENEDQKGPESVDL